MENRPSKEFNYNHLPDPQEEGDFVSTPNVVRTDKDLVVKDFFVANNNEVRMLRGQMIARRANSGNYTCAVSDYLIAITSLAVAPSIGLPSPSLAGVGKTYRIKDEVGGAATTTITVRSDKEKLIDGAASTTLTTNYQSKLFYTDGSNWFTL